MVDTLHPSYELSQASWKFMRTSIAGDEAVKEAGVTYVPKLSGQTDTEYTAYIGRPYYEEYTQRVLDGTTGLIFSKTPASNIPTSMDYLTENINLSGKTLTDFTQEITEEVEAVGRVGALVDMGNSEGKNRVYSTIYPTESIINWKYETINNEPILTMVVLHEVITRWLNEFESEVVNVYRVLKLEEKSYKQVVYTENKSTTTNNKSSFTTEEIIPQMNGKPLDYIPFVSITPQTLTLEPAKPPLIGLARVNMAHFKLNVDYYHGMHFTALPTPYGSGIQASVNAQGVKEVFKIGSTSISMFDNPQAKLSYLEFEGKGLETLENEKEKLIDAMVVLGSNMLQGDKKAAESENTVAMRSAGQNATLVSTADTVSRGVVKVLEIMRDWSGLTGDISYKLNTDYLQASLSPQLLKEIIAGRTLTEIPQKVLIHNLREGELLPDDMTDEDYLTQLEEETPKLTVSPIAPKEEDKGTLDKIREKIGL